MSSRRPPRDRAKPKPPEASPRGVATLADLDALGEDVRAELIDGVIYKLPMTSGIHGHIAAQILAAIFREAPLVADWWVQPENDFIAGGQQVLRPDVVGWRKARLPSPSTSGRIDVLPDWICEIHSPANKRHDLRKRTVYARLGVPAGWYIDPDEKTLTVYQLRDGEWRAVAVHRGDEDVCAPPFDGVRFRLRDWWG